jgi:hypothetical protein
MADNLNNNLQQDSGQVVGQDDQLFSNEKLETYEIKGDPVIKKDFYVSSGINNKEHPDLNIFNLDKSDVIELIRPYARLDHIYGNVYKDKDLFFRSSESYLPFVDIYFGYHINYFERETSDFLYSFIQNNKVENFDKFLEANISSSLNENKEDLIFFEDRLNSIINEKDKLRGFYVKTSGMVYIKMPDYMQSTLTSISVSRKLLRNRFKNKKSGSASTTTQTKPGEDFDLEISSYPNEMTLTFTYPINFFYRFNDQFENASAIFPPYPFLRYTQGNPTKILVIYGYMGFGFYEKILRTVFLHKHKFSPGDFKNQEETISRVITPGKDLNPCDEFFNAGLGNLDFKEFIKLSIPNNENAYIFESIDGEEVINSNSGTSESDNKVKTKDVEVKESELVNTCVSFALQPYIDFFVPDKRFYFTVAPVSIAFAGFIDKVSFKGNDKSEITLTYNCVAMKDFSYKDNPVRADIDYSDITKSPEKKEGSLIEIKNHNVKEYPPHIEIKVKNQQTNELSRIERKVVEKSVERFFVRRKDSVISETKYTSDSNLVGDKIYKYKDESLGCFIIRCLLMFLGSNSYFFETQKERDKLFEYEVKAFKDSQSARFSYFYMHFGNNAKIKEDPFNSDIVRKSFTFGRGYFVYTHRCFYSKESIANYFTRPPLTLFSEYDFNFYVSLFKYFTLVPKGFYDGFLFPSNDIIQDYILLYYRNTNFFGDADLTLQKSVDLNPPQNDLNVNLKDLYGKFYKIFQGSDEKYIGHATTEIISDYDKFIKVYFDSFSTYFISTFGFMRGFSSKNDVNNGFNTKVNIYSRPRNPNSPPLSLNVYTIKKVYDHINSINSNLGNEFLKDMDKFYNELIKDGFSFRDNNKHSYLTMNVKIPFKLKDNDEYLDFNDDTKYPMIKDVLNPFSLYILNSALKNNLEFSGVSVMNDNILELFYIYQKYHLFFSYMLNLGDVNSIRLTEQGIEFSNSKITFGAEYDKIHPLEASSGNNLTNGQKLRFFSSIHINNKDLGFPDVSTLPSILFIESKNSMSFKSILRDAQTNSEERKVVNYLFEEYTKKTPNQKIFFVGITDKDLSKGVHIGDIVEDEKYLDCFIRISEFKVICISNFLKLKNYSSSKGFHNQYVYGRREMDSIERDVDSSEFSDKIVFVDEFGGVEGIFQSYFRLNSQLFAKIPDFESEEGFASMLSEIFESAFEVFVDKKRIYHHFVYTNAYENNTSRDQTPPYHIFYFDLTDVIREIEGAPFTDFDEYMLDVMNQEFVFSDKKKGGVVFDKYGYKYPIKKLSDLNYSIIPTLDSYKGKPIYPYISNVLDKKIQDSNIPSALIEYYKVILSGKYNQKILKGLINTQKLKKSQAKEVAEVKPIKFITIPVKEIPVLYLEYGEEVIDFSFDFESGTAGKEGSVKNIELSKSFFAQVEVDKEAIRRYWEEQRGLGVSRNQIMMDIVNLAKQNPTELIRRFSKLVFRYSYREGDKIVEPSEPGEAKIFKLELKLKFAIPGLKPGIYIWFDEKPTLIGSYKMRVSLPYQIKGPYMVSEVKENLLTNEGIIEQTITCVR